MTDVDVDLDAGPDGSPMEPYLVDALDVAGATVAVILLALVAGGATGPARILLALAFTTFVPGWAILDWVPIGHGMTRVALAVAVSLALCTGAAQAVLWLHVWQPLAVFYVLAPLSAAALLAHLALAGTLLGLGSDR